MKLAISNIAWQASEELQVADLLREMGVEGVELAPTKQWPQPLAATDVQVGEYRDLWARRGVRIVALQALLFGRTDLTIFESVATRKATFEYLSGMIRLAGKLGAAVLVFGSPKNRQAGALAPDAARAIAIPFFRDLAVVAADHQTMFCIEPNPTEYGCDFLTTSTAALDLIGAVNHQGLGLHLDAGGMNLAGEFPTVVDRCLPWLRHFHISEPHLEVIGAGDTDHRGYAETLARISYGGWTSIEMRAAATGNVRRVADALTYAVDRYAPLLATRQGQ